MTTAAMHPGAPMMLIGLATVSLIERDEPVTVGAIKSMLSVLTGKEDAELLRLALQRLDYATNDTIRPRRGEARGVMRVSTMRTIGSERFPT